MRWRHELDMKLSFTSRSAHTLIGRDESLLCWKLPWAALSLILGYRVDSALVGDIRLPLNRNPTAIVEVVAA